MEVATTTPSTRKETLEIPTGDDAFAVKVTWPDSVEPAAGPVSDTVGVDGGPPESMSE